MNPQLDKLKQYPFSQLSDLLSAVTPADLPAFSLSMGEPQHPVPDFVNTVLADSVKLLSKYPPTPGSFSLREIIAKWLTRRFSLSENSINPNTNVLVASGSREALFGIAQCVVDASKDDEDNLVMLPNPGYQIYEGAAIMAGATPYYLPTLSSNGFLPDYPSIPNEIWEKTQLLYYCSPGNPIGVLHTESEISWLINQSQKYDFTIVADECYSEIYTEIENKPLSILSVAEKLGISDFKRCIAMNSLSKRSNLAGLRSGIIAGDAEIISRFQQLRSYQGTAMSLAFQAVSEKAWAEESHVEDNRQKYRDKFELAQRTLTHVPDWAIPAGGFFLWLGLPDQWIESGKDDTTFAQYLIETQNLKILPGQFLSRKMNGLQNAESPGKNFIRVALVDEIDEIEVALKRLNQGYIDAENI